MTDDVIPPGGRADIGGDEHLACTVLSAQMHVLCRTIEDAANMEAVWQIVEDLSRLGTSSLHPAGEPAGMISTLSQRLEAQMFGQAQGWDRAYQMASGISAALEQLTTSDQPAGSRLMPSDLQALYVCDEQRQTHANILRRPAMGGR